MWEPLRGHMTAVFPRNLAAPLIVTAHEITPPMRVPTNAALENVAGLIEFKVRGSGYVQALLDSLVPMLFELRR